jgi:hypothetical protein
MTEYKKYCYWLDLDEFRSVRRAFEEKGIQGNDETHLPCRVLRASKELGYIAPSAWNGFCKRRTSWYWKSKKAEKFLIVGNKPWDILGDKETSTIVESNFKPDHLPSQKEILELIELEEYRKRKPKEWDKPDLIEKDFYLKCFERYGGKDPFDFNKILISHSANHANFIDPQFFVNVKPSGHRPGLPGKEISFHIVPLDPAYKAGLTGHDPVKGEKAPYSISDSLYVCSSCLEFFNILGEQWPTKYVVPCIGAVKFAGLPMNQYFKVEVLRAKPMAHPSTARGTES